MNRYSWLILLLKFVQAVLPHGVTVLGRRLTAKKDFPPTQWETIPFDFVDPLEKGREVEARKKDGKKAKA